MSSLHKNEKLSEVLELFLLPNYNIVSTTYLDLLLSHISKDIKERKKISNIIIIIYNKIIIKNSFLYIIIIFILSLQSILLFKYDSCFVTYFIKFQMTQLIMKIVNYFKNGC